LLLTLRRRGTGIGWAGALIPVSHRGTIPFPAIGFRASVAVVMAGTSGTVIPPWWPGLGCHTDGEKTANGCEGTRTGLVGVLNQCSALPAVLAPVKPPGLTGAADPGLRERPTRSTPGLPTPPTPLPVPGAIEPASTLVVRPADAVRFTARVRARTASLIAPEAS
jgi:hypothetical protein